MTSSQRKSWVDTLGMRPRGNTTSIPALTSSMRFLLVGLTNNAFIFGLYSILVYSDVNSVLAVTITFPLGMALSYVAQRFWSFRLREIGTSSILRFLVLSGLDYALNASMIWILTDVARLNPYVGQAMCIGLIAAVNFFLMRYWVYRSD